MNTTQDIAEFRKIGGRISWASEQGRRPAQEDAVVVHKLNNGVLLAVADGHGGRDVARFVIEKLPGICDTELRRNAPAEALRRVFKELAMLTDGMLSGSTLSVVFVPNACDIAHFATLGDSPVIVRDEEGKILSTVDHNVRTNATEREAAISRGGVFDGSYIYEPSGNYGLQMSRALGDALLKRILSREPDVDSAPLGEKSFILVASDGVFDPGHANTLVTQKEVLRLIGLGSDATEIVKRAVDKPTHDNATAILWKRA